MTNDKQALEFNDLNQPEADRVVKKLGNLQRGCFLNSPTVMVIDMMGISYVFYLMQVSRCESKRKIFSLALLICKCAVKLRVRII